MLVILVLLMVFTPSRPLECPTQCRCSNYKTWCKHSRLYKLPSQLPDTTELLSIRYDDIKILSRSMVTRSGLRNLTYLELNEVQLQQIKPGTFKHMNVLQKLIITNNNISELHADTFKYLKKLYYLKLQNNNIKLLHHGTFLQLAKVRYLYLDECGILPMTNVSDSVKNSSNCAAMKTPGVLNIFTCYANIDLRALQHLLCFFTKIHLNFLPSIYTTKEQFIGTARVTDLKLFDIEDRILINIFNGLEKLTKLEITSIELHDIESGTFENLTRLNYLVISDVKLSEIRSGMFRGLRSLKVLKLKRTDISILENNGFEGLQSLESLSLDECRISDINNDTFIALNNLRELFISSLYLKQIDAAAFNGLNEIKTIDITNYLHNIISYKNNIFSKLKTLTVLKLSYIKFSLEAGTFTEVRDIKIFSKNISHKLQNISYSDYKYEITLQRLTFVMEATFGDIGIRATVKSVQGHQTLQELQLFVNGETPKLKKQAQDVIEDTVNFTHINKISTHLDISNRYLVLFKENRFFGFSNIKSLSLTNITTLEIHANALTQLKSLTSLTIKLNDHVIIAPGAFTGLCNLKKLELHWKREILIKRKWPIRHRSITRYLHINQYEPTQFESGMFQGLDNLEILDFYGGEFPFDENTYLSLNRGIFQGLHNIIEIQLSYNKIKEIPPGVFGAECVKYFKVSCKNVSEPSPYCNDTHALKTLQHLDLSNNKIRYIHQHAFISCVNLQTINLEWNIFLTLDNTFLFTPALTTLNMKWCNVTNIPNNTFECTPNIYELTLTIYKTPPHVTPFLPLKQLKQALIYINDYKLTCDFYETWLWFEDKHITPYLDYHPDPRRAIYKLNCNTTHQQSQQPPNSKVNINDSMYLKQYIEPIILVVITTAGLVFNGFLLFVSLWNSDMRIKHNSCIIHLSITDTLSLILNLPLSYWNTLQVNWKLRVLTCKMFMFLKDVTLVANIFSIVALSIERFLVARRWNDLRKACKTDYPIWWLLVMTWVSGIILSLPTYYNASVHTRCLYCPPNNEEYMKNVWIYQLIIHYFLPAVAICALNTMTSRYLRQSIKNLPGVVNDNTRTKNRKTVANIVSILSAIFVFSYLPNFTLRILVAWSFIDIEDALVYSFVSFCLFYCNTLFNPISIFIMSSKYKNYFFKYFPFLSNTDTKINPAAKKIN
ncbi:hypothetical protein L9F63_026909 [Diploptera punctata]|uniref:G-protein coupled receptors family 1 profile domain-containing protein n=1 Tax=Diploptera punctata TaxID=6984 RepID=A0AAD8EPT8_DIPPU|nr:hypothetical protein L9F63_026909 [Diploptera punctata]